MCDVRSTFYDRSRLSTYRRLYVEISFEESTTVILFCGHKCFLLLARRISLAVAFSFWSQHLGKCRDPMNGIL